jgi:hypothetical protein
MAADSDKRWFEKNPKKTIATVAVLAIAVLLFIAEYSLRYMVGLGDQVLYDSNPFYGFRPVPNQVASAFFGKKIRINNLGIRADEDWNGSVEDKVLFLGDSVTYGGAYISNDELFSHLALEGIEGFRSGNSGVNAWGVENIHGLIVESGFLPAKVYVTTLVEGDFYRGLTRVQGMPYWNRKQKLALLELLDYLCYTRLNKRYTRWTTFTDDGLKEKVVLRAVKRLDEMDRLLKSRNYKHLIYITPTKKQILDNQNRDPLIQKHIINSGLNVIYIMDRINKMTLTDTEKEALFHDSVHLEIQGHALWGKIINDDLKKLLEK